MDLLDGVTWTLLRTAPGAAAEPSDLGGESGIEVSMPDTVAGALRRAGHEVPGSAELDGHDWWLRTTVRGLGRHLLTFDGLATVADVWVAGTAVLHSESMFRAHRVEVDLHGDTELAVRCAAPLVWLGRRPRPRWKSTLVGEQRWRWLRTTALGRINSWAGPVAPVGIWRPARLVPLDTPVVADARLAPRVAAGHGSVDVVLDMRGTAAQVSATVAGRTVDLTSAEDGCWRGSVAIGPVELWWPRGYGAQPRYPVTVVVDGAQHDLGAVGFRTVEARTADGGFRLAVNGVEVFARGAVWEPTDPVGFASEAEVVRAALTQLADAGHTMVRVPGTGVYETDDFYALCDELGLLVWQDCMLTTLDPPDTAEFLAEVALEVTQLAHRLAGRACIAVVCGGAETEQQPALLGLHEQPIPVLTDTVPAVLAEHLPGVPYVTGTPSGGALPVHTGTGIAQYFGVGAYLRPMSDVRSAGVRFAGESLAFSVPPEPGAVLDAFGSPRVAGHDPRWKAAVPRDPGAAWDFEDVRDHYVAELFGVDPRRERYSDPGRYLDLGRAAVCTAMAEVLSWWRRSRSGCGGALVLSARDLTPGAGWGLTDSSGGPKAPLFALQPVLAPLALLIGDDAGDGLTITAVNDGSAGLVATLQVQVFGADGAVLDSAERALRIPAHGDTDVSLDDVIGRFTDANHYYRFGPKARDAVSARLVDKGGQVLARCTALLGHQLRAPAAVDAALHGTGDSWSVRVTAGPTPVQWLALDCVTHAVDANWFHLAPGESRSVTLTGAAIAPQLTVRALNVAERTVPVTGEHSR